MFSVLQRTTQVTNQRHSTSVTLVCVKMASVMGVTWILGIAANVHALSFLWYPYVVLNSLQGIVKPLLSGHLRDLPKCPLNRACLFIIC